MIEPRLELGTFGVLDRGDDLLHHPSTHDISDLNTASVSAWTAR